MIEYTYRVKSGGSYFELPVVALDEQGARDKVRAYCILRSVKIRQLKLIGLDNKPVLS
jgi:hypothetical protein